LLVPPEHFFVFVFQMPFPVWTNVKKRFRAAVKCGRQSIFIFDSSLQVHCTERPQTETLRFI